MPTNVIFIHGYSESTLGAYYEFPVILKNAAPSIKRIILSAFDSLDDGITIDDLANALEDRIAVLEGGADPLVITDTAVICHSTGALIARRWILNRLSRKAIPSHLITIAGANHGSTLAQMGKSVLGYFQKLALKHELSVGKRVLIDLDYGSDFLLRLNTEWLSAWNDGRLSSLYAFSMGGDSTGADKDPTLDVFWQTHESGSDNTVRISGANLNYTIVSASHDENGTSVGAITPKRAIPHRILEGFSHFGPATGILGNVHNAGDLPMASVTDALNVSTPEEYASLGAEWAKEIVDWTTRKSTSANSTIVFSLLDRNGASIDDCMIALLDQSALGDVANAVGLEGTAQRAAALNNVSSCILPHSPIQNDTRTGSYSFYINFDGYLQTSPHWVHIDINSGALIGQYKYQYGDLLFTQPPELPHLITPNQFTYICIRIGRQSNEAYALYGWDSALNLNAVTFPPFTPDHRLAPP